MATSIDNPVKKVWPGEGGEDPPTQAQIALAETLAKSRGVRSEDLVNIKTKAQMSDWITNAKQDAALAGQSGFTPVKVPNENERNEPATQNQLDFANRLAQSTLVGESGLTNLKTKGEVSDFIQNAVRKTQHVHGQDPTNAINPLKTVQPGEGESDPATGRQNEFIDRISGHPAVDSTLAEQIKEVGTKGEASEFLSDAQRSVKGASSNK